MADAVFVPEVPGVTDMHNGLTPTARILELESQLVQAKREAEDACQHVRVVIGQRDAQYARREEAEATAKRAVEELGREKERADAAIRLLESLRSSIRGLLDGH